MMNPGNLLGVALAATLTCLPARLSAHGDVHPLIAELTKKLQSEPRNAKLYLDRGEYYRSDGNWKDAAADFDRAGECDPQWALVHLSRGRLWLDAGDPRKALTSLDRYLVLAPKDVDGLVYRARAKARLNEFLAAAADYATAIGHAQPPRPELFIEHAEVLKAAGPKHFEAAIQTLDDGIRKMGPLVTLELPAIDLEVTAGRADAALARIDRLAAQSPRKESWCLRRGEILEQAGRPAEARVAYEAGWTALQSLPPGRRNTRATQDLESRIQSGRQRLAKAETGKKP